jgi:hypothetical protein
MTSFSTSNKSREINHFPKRSRKNMTNGMYTYRSETTFSKFVPRQMDYDELMDKVWDELRVLVPLETR